MIFLAAAIVSVPLPTQRQLDFMDLELTQFMHFGIPTFWDPPEEYLHGPNPTYHDCSTTVIDHSNQTEGYYPCLNPNVFNPTDLNAEEWMEASASMGMREIIITAHHEGGFALWPSNFTDYSVAASSWRNGKGDVLREFADAANKWGIGISYYLNVQNDGYMKLVANYTPAEFIRRQVCAKQNLSKHYMPVVQCRCFNV
jgi:alpha-L-fucosidase